MKINPGSLGFPDYYAYLHVINKIYQLFIYSLSLVFQLSAKTEKVPAESIPYFPVIYFKTDRYSIDKVQEWKIEDIACYMEEYPETILLVKGWTDSKGTEEGNERLSQLRADEVKERLVRSGVDSWRIIAIGMGEAAIGSDANISRRAESEIISFR